MATPNTEQYFITIGWIDPLTGKAYSATWVQCGTSEDVKKAKAYAPRVYQDAVVFAWPLDQDTDGVLRKTRASISASAGSAHQPMRKTP